ncbi:hypothetical protein Rsub_09876 [Raphidocelis subcapitata]|uniref:Uncharacterized protein n=1 Tax=Raphidocelis subcapitata TaxID=307507 RepID=A0A2V0PAI5_9CHLO|nr:hypothetical protein Rsub_09876 [Raphidocelis subcapitata]|eukprot:GBF96871.1 hypothetical protein Rsub_09876 [Raphidocelis subcapitata]
MQALLRNRPLVCRARSGAGGARTGRREPRPGAPAAATGGSPSAGAAEPPAWPRVPLLRLALCGATLGTALDGIHSRVALQVYDLAPVRLETPLGPLDTSLLVPPLLATWYAVMGALLLAADAASPLGGAPSTAAARAAAAAGGWGRVAAGYGLLAANLQLSAFLYSRGVDYGSMTAALLATWAASWWALDRTRHGAALSLICALGAPAAELVLMSVFHTWHYSRPDLDFGAAGAFVSFVPCCYGGYVPQLAALTRHLAARAGRGQAEGQAGQAGKGRQQRRGGDL